jgi:hypothetical protein
MDRERKTDREKERERDRGSERERAREKCRERDLELGLVEVEGCETRHQRNLKAAQKLL